MKAVFLSKFLEIGDVVNTVDNEIHVFTQFFIHRHAMRNHELRHCLMANVMNPYITKIHLLNERIYTKEELGLAKIDDKSLESRLVQYNTGGKRWTPQMAFQYIREHGLKGYFVFINADIFLDKTIRHLLASTIHEKKQALALLRYEYTDGSIGGMSAIMGGGGGGGNGPVGGLAACPLFGPRFDSQDTWILHSNHLPKENQERIFHHEFGKAGRSEEHTSELQSH